MEDNRQQRLLERELYQIEQIRQLDSEELEIEEVENGHQSSDDDQIDERAFAGTSASGGYTFNTSLASMHSYLGEVEDTHNRLAFLDGGVILHVPLFILKVRVVLFPEATLPLRVIQPNFIAAVDRALRQVEAPYTIGVVRVFRDGDNGRIKFATREQQLSWTKIRQYRRLEDGSNKRSYPWPTTIPFKNVVGLNLKEQYPCGEIQIIEEDLPLRTPRDAFGKLTPLRNLSTANVSHSKLLDHDSDDSFESELSLTERRLHASAIKSSSHRNFFSESTSSDDESPVCEPQPLLHSRNNESIEDMSAKKYVSERPRRRAQREFRSVPGPRECPRAFWPYWVYRMHDSYCLAQRLSDMWKKIVGTPSMDALVRQPGLLSFHVASKIPVSESTRQELLEIDGISYRLRREIELLENFDQIKCRSCQTLIANRSDMLVMSTDGPLGAYVNPSGYVHEIMTLLKASGLALIGVPTEEYSWFPGYAWTVAYCATCEYQMGWLFTATNKKLKTAFFLGHQEFSSGR
ncbi:putative Lon, substrate-binding domain, PUA-like superfamily, CULT domain-containing protein [Helianthus annuus]|nr:putative Lon, substrate-binding domain, PUA-like superfamily, CULT domain-containing protein [Helianthus annuus]